MKLFKKMSRILVFSLAFNATVLGAATAFADSTVPVAPTSLTSVNTSVNGGSSSAAVSDSVYGEGIGQIDSLYNQLLSLRQQDKDLDVTMKTQHELNEAAIKAIRAQVSADDLAKIKAVEDQNRSIRNSGKPLFDQWKFLNLELRVARKAKDEKLTAELRLQLNELKKQIQPLSDQIKANNNSIKDVRLRVNAARNQIHTVLAPLKPLEQQISGLWSTVKSLEQQKKQAWGSFNAAVNNGDVNGALQSLTQIVTLKQQILDAKKQIYSLQQQIGSALAAK